MIWLFLVSVFLLQFVSYSYAKSSVDVGTAPPPGSTSKVMYDAFGGIAGVAVIALLIWGFFVFAWWIPICSGLGIAVCVGVVYIWLPKLGATYVLFGFPVGFALGLTTVLLN